MEAPPQILPNRMLLLLSVFVTIPHIILFLDSTFPGPVCKNYAFLDYPRSKTLLYLGSLYSAAILTWALFAKCGDFFSDRPSPSKANGVPVESMTTPAVARENSRYLCVLKVVLLSQTTLAIDLSWAWYRGVVHAWGLPVVTEVGNFHKFMSTMMFPLMASWLTIMWALGNFIAFGAVCKLIVVGKDAGVELVVRSNRSSSGLQDDKKELFFEASDL